MMSEPEKSIAGPVPAGAAPQAPVAAAEAVVAQPEALPPMTINAAPPKPKEKAPWLLYSLFAVVAILPIVVIGLNHRDNIAAMLAPDTPPGGIEVPSKMSVGEGRNVLLAEISAKYAGPDAAGRKARGELAPVEFLNAALAERRLPYRVRAIDGGRAATFDVSQ